MNGTPKRSASARASVVLPEALVPTTFTRRMGHEMVPGRAPGFGLAGPGSPCTMPGE